MTFWPVATSKVPESVAEGEDKEKDSGEETTVTKPLGKEEAEVSELKVETPELKVKLHTCHKHKYEGQVLIRHVVYDENL